MTNIIYSQIIMSEKPTNKQLFDTNKMTLDQQDQMLDDILVEVEQTKGLNKDISKEVDKQKVLMTDMKSGMNKVDTKMRKANEKIADLLKEQSFCKLYVIILLEVIVMLLLILL